MYFVKRTDTFCQVFCTKLPPLRPTGGSVLLIQPRKTEDPTNKTESCRCLLALLEQPIGDQRSQIWSLIAVYSSPVCRSSWSGSWPVLHPDRLLHPEITHVQPPLCCWGELPRLVRWHRPALLSQHWKWEFILFFRQRWQTLDYRCLSTGKGGRAVRSLLSCIGLVPTEKKEILSMPFKCPWICYVEFFFLLSAS